MLKILSSRTTKMKTLSPEEIIDACQALDAADRRKVARALLLPRSWGNLTRDISGLLIRWSRARVPTASFFGRPAAPRRPGSKAGIPVAANRVLARD